jgi:hypothetical protein
MQPKKQQQYCLIEQFQYYPFEALCTNVAAVGRKDGKVRLKRLRFRLQCDALDLGINPAFSVLFLKEKEQVGLKVHHRNGFFYYSQARWTISSTSPYLSLELSVCLQL